MSYVRNFDRSVISIVEKLPDWVQPVMSGASFIGHPAALIAVLLAVMGATFVQKNMRLLASETVVLAMLPLASLLKILTQRDRPETLYVENMLFKTYSFPSGHAYASLVVFGFLAYLCLHYFAAPWGWLAASLLMALVVLVGVSRVYLGAHFPSDVLGGWVLGAVALALVIKFAVKL